MTPEQKAEFTPIERDYIEKQFERFYENKMLFADTSVALVMMMANAEDAEEMLSERKYYGQIVAAILEDKRESITFDEKVLFINMHMALKKIYDEQNG